MTGPPPDRRRALLGIPYVNRPDLLQRAIESTGELRSMTRVIDNSDTGLDPADWNVPIFRPPVPLTFSQSMNLLQRQAVEIGASTLLYMHNDAQAGPGTPECLLKISEEATAAGRRWGVAFTYYDALAAYQPEVFHAVGPWDTALPQYFADNDYYRRIRLAGYEVLETALPVVHEPSSTIRSDRSRSFLNGVTFPLYERYYIAKWGGPPGQERFSQPFNGSLDGLH